MRARARNRWARLAEAADRGRERKAGLCGPGLPCGLGRDRRGSVVEQLRPRLPDSRLPPGERRDR